MMVHCLARFNKYIQALKCILNGQFKEQTIGLDINLLHGRVESSFLKNIQITMFFGVR